MKESVLLFLYLKTKKWIFLHEMCSYLFRYALFPFISLSFKFYLLDPKVFVIYRHSLAEPGEFNLFMSDLDLTIITQNNEKQILRALTCHKWLKKLLLNLGEAEIYTILEWEELKQLEANPWAKWWKLIFYIRKYKWENDKLNTTKHDYHKVKAQRALGKCNRKLNMTTNTINGDMLFPLNVPITFTSTSEQTLYIPYLYLYATNGKTEIGQLKLIFNNDLSRSYFSRIIPNNQNEVELLNDNLRQYFFRREYYLSLNSMRLGAFLGQKDLSELSEWNHVMKVNS